MVIPNIVAYIIMGVAAVGIALSILSSIKGAAARMKTEMPFLKRFFKIISDRELSHEEKKAETDELIQEMEFGEHNYSSGQTHSLINSRPLYDPAGTPIPHVPLTDAQLRARMTVQDLAEYDQKVREYRLEIYELEKQYNSIRDENTKTMLMQQKLQLLDELESFMDSYDLQ